MMKKKWMVALGLGLLAGLVHFWYVGKLKADIQGGRSIDVLVFATNLKTGKAIEEVDLASRPVPRAYVDNRMVTKGRAKDIVGLTATVDLEAGQTVQWSDFAKRLDPEANNLAQLIESGKRAIAISVDSSLSMSGLLRPGHRVDILGTFSKGNAFSGEKIAATLLQNVLVLATGKNLGHTGEPDAKISYKTVTLSVGIEEAELLSLAMTRGTLSLALRGHQDLTIVSDVPEKKMTDIWDAERRNAVQQRTDGNPNGIERLSPK
jgi:pilus assembly protein CpaB